MVDIGGACAIGGFLDGAHFIVLRDIVGVIEQRFAVLCGGQAILSLFRSSDSE
jgi:hypothetical protein